MKNYYEKSCKQVREFFLGILSFSFCGPRAVKSEWLRKNWSQTQDVTPAVALETLPPWSKTRLCHLFFGEGKGRGIQHFTFTTIVYKIEETLRVIEHLSAYNNWKMGGGGVKQRQLTMNDQTLPISWWTCYTEPHTKNFRWKTAELPLYA